MKTFVFLLLCVSVFAGTYIPNKDKSSTKKVSIKVEKVSNAELVRKWDKPKRFWNTYYKRDLRLTAYGDNRNQEETTVSVTIYLIGKNKQGLYQLLESESSSTTMPKYSKKSSLLVVRYTYHDWVSGSLSKLQYEYRGCCVVLKGADGKIITADGEYGNFYKFIESKGEKDTFNSKGEAKVPRRTGS